MASAQEKALFAALYAREYNKFMLYADTLNPVFGSDPDNPEQKAAPWLHTNEPGVTDKGTWVAARAYESAQQALGSLQMFAEYTAVAAEAQDPPELGLREVYADFTGISETPPA